MRTLIVSFDDRHGSEKFLKLQTKLSFVLNRIDNLKTKDDDERKLKSELLSTALVLMTDFNGQVRETEAKLTSTPVNVTVLQEGSADDSDDELERQSNMCLPTAVTKAVKSVPVSKWNLRLSSDKKGLSVNAFLQRVCELKVARHVDDELFSTAVDLFEGLTLIWYRAVREDVYSWQELSARLREEFNRL